jgi:hypothetical protein
MLTLRRFLLRTLQKLGDKQTQYWRHGFIVTADDGLGMVGTLIVSLFQNIFFRLLCGFD